MIYTRRGPADNIEALCGIQSLSWCLGGGNREAVAKVEDPEMASSTINSSKRKPAKKATSSPGKLVKGSKRKTAELSEDELSRVAGGTPGLKSPVDWVQ